jgi:hypothetical protein
MLTIYLSNPSKKLSICRTYMGQICRHDQIRITLIKHYYFPVHTLGSKPIEVKVKAEAWSLN